MRTIQYVFVFHTTSYIYHSTMSKLRYRTVSSYCSGKYIGFGLRIETRTEKTMI